MVLDPRPAGVVLSGSRSFDMSGEEALQDDDFDGEGDDAGQETETAEVVVKIVNSEARRRLEDRLEERRLQKLIRDYDYDID